MKKKDDSLLWILGGGLVTWYFVYYCLQNGSEDHGILEFLPALPAPPFLPTIGGCEFPCTLIHKCENLLDMGAVSALI